MTNFRLSQTEEFADHNFNPLLDTPVLGSSSSAENEDMMSKIWTNGYKII